MRKITKTTQTKPIIRVAKQVAIPTKSRAVGRKVDIDSLIPSPCTAFNLECSGRWEGAFQLGTIANLIGDSHAGKTLFALSTIAECAKLSRFNDYIFRYDDVEDANEFDLPYLFGKKCADRIEDSDETRSWTIEQFSDSISNLLNGDKPFIYVLDSFDALTTESAIKLGEKNKKKRAKGEESDGTYGDGKPALFSEFCKANVQKLRKKKSFIMIISQTRDTIGFGSQFNPKRRSGGRALKFYSFHEVWLATQKQVKEGKRRLITDVQAKITKNKLTGRHGECIFPILFDYGIDNIASCINFLASEGDNTTKWTGTKAALNTKGFHSYTDIKGNIKHPRYADIVKHIEKNNLELELNKLCQDAYDISIESMRTNRKRKY